MTIEDKLQNYILENYKSIMQFAKEADLPYTTVKGIFTRGLWGASVQNVTKICDKLNIEIESLINGQITTKTLANGISFHEQQVINSYREQPNMQEAVDRLLGIKHTDEESDKKEKLA